MRAQARVRSRTIIHFKIQFSLVKADASDGDFLSGLRRVRLTRVKMTWIGFRAVGICPGYSESGLAYVRLNEGEMYRLSDLGCIAREKWSIARNITNMAPHRKIKSSSVAQASSEAFLARVSVRSARKLFIFIIKNMLTGSNYPKKH